MNTTALPKKTSPIYMGLFWFIIATLSLLFFSPTTSPLWGDTYGCDSDIFKIIGKAWAENKLPYVDAWDLKGPYIFLVNAIGYKITGSKLGVFLLQVLSLGTTLTILHHWICTFIKSRWASLSLSFLCLLYFIASYEDGNCVEEYGLPFLAMSFYLMHKWIVAWNKGEQRHSYLAAFIYGITFGICAATRLTNALGLCAGIAVIGFTLLFAKQWKNTAYNICFLLLGVGCAIIPFIAYFAAYDAVGELWYGTIGYNLDYAGAPIHKVGIIGMIISIGRILTSASYILIVLSLWAILIKGQRLFGILCLAIALPVFYWFSNSNGYAHYGIIAVPTLPFIYKLTQTIYRTCQSSQRALLLKCALSIPLFFLVVAPLRGLRFNPTVLYFFPIDTAQRLTAPNKDISSFIGENVPAKHRNTVILYGILPAYYLETNITSCSPYFSLQEWQAGCSKSWKQRLYNDCATLEATHIFTQGETTVIAPIIAQHYTLKDSLNVPNESPILLYIRNDLK